MTFERFKDAWQRPLDTEGEPRREDAATVLELRVRKPDRQVFRRDLVETIAAVGVIAFLGASFGGVRRAP